MSDQEYNAWVQLFAFMVREYVDHGDMIYLQNSTIGDMIFSNYKFDTPESEDAAWEEFWSRLEKAFAIFFKENMYE